MRRLVLLAVTALAVGGLASTSNAGLAVNVTASDYAFDPDPLTVPFSSFNYLSLSNDGEETHTATSDRAGFFDTGDVAPGNQGFDDIQSSGSFSYHCELHDGMTGILRVRPIVDDPDIGIGESATISYTDTATKGIASDVERKRNDGEWRLVVDHTFQTSFVFTPSREGTFLFRTRVYNVRDRASDWSPKVRVVVS